MECKNCHKALTSNKYCAECGAKVVTEKLSVKGFWKQFSSQFLGWDNRFLRTFKGMFLKPEILLNEYISGTRKKYVAPMLFLGFTTAAAMIVFNTFQEEYLTMLESANSTQFEFIKPDLESEQDIKEYEDRLLKQAEMGRKVQRGIVKYFNLFSFLLVPLFAGMSYWIYRRKHSYAEHLVFNCYLQGVSMIISLLLFIFALLISPSLFFFSTFITIVLYLYVFKRLYNQSIGQVVISFLKFILAIALTLLILIILGGIVGVIIAFLSK